MILNRVIAFNAFSLKWNTGVKLIGTTYSFHQLVFNKKWTHMVGTPPILIFHPIFKYSCPVNCAIRFLSKF